MAFSDTYKLHTVAIDDVIRDYVSAKAWLDSKGINVSPSRFNAYRKKIESTSVAATLQEAFQVLWMHVELHDLSEIFHQLSGIESPSLLESLTLAVKGPFLLDDETVKGSSNKGRNISFELYLAARLARAGLPVGFDSAADVDFEFGDRRYYVECKRVFNEAKLDGLVVEAMKQVERRCVDVPDAKGLVAISVTKLVHKAVAMSATSVFADLPEMQQLFRDLVEEWGALFQKHFSTQSINTVGILLHYKIPFVDISSGAVAFLSRFSMIHLNNGIENNILAHEVSKLFDASVTEGLDVMSM